MSTRNRIDSLKQKLALGGMLFLATTAASAQDLSDADAKNSANKEYNMKKDAKMDLLLKIFNKEFDESYKILQQKSLNGNKYSALGVPQDGAVKDAVEYDPLDGCSAQNDIINLGTSSIQRINDGHFIVTLKPDYFSDDETKPNEPIVINTKNNLSTEDLEQVHANVNYVLLIADGEYKNTEFLYNCGDKLIHGEKLTKNEQNKLNKIVENFSTSFAFHQMRQKAEKNFGMSQDITEAKERVMNHLKEKHPNMTEETIKNEAKTRHLKNNIKISKLIGKDIND